MNFTKKKNIEKNKPMPDRSVSALATKMQWIDSKNYIEKTKNTLSRQKDNIQTEWTEIVANKKTY